MVRENQAPIHDDETKQKPTKWRRVESDASSPVPAVNIWTKLVLKLKAELTRN